MLYLSLKDMVRLAVFEYSPLSKKLIMLLHLVCDIDFSLLKD